jgi:hypothetical protein
MHCPRLNHPPKWKDVVSRALLLGIPLVGPQRSVYKNLCRQLAGRNADCWRAWGDDPKRLVIAKFVAGKFAEAAEWPNAIFIPADPFELIAWDHNSYAIDDLSLLDALLEIEKHLAIHLTDEQWRFVFKKSFGEAVDFLVEQQHLSKA